MVLDRVLRSDRTDDDLVHRARKVATDLAGTPRAAAAADLVKMAEEAARLKR